MNVHPFPIPGLQHALASKLGAILARAEIHTKPEIVSELLGLSRDPAAFDGARMAVLLHNLAWEASLPGPQGARVRQEAEDTPPFLAFERNLPPRTRALDCLRMCLKGTLSPEEKVWLHRTWLIEPVSGFRRDGTPGFYWRHPSPPTDMVDEIDWESFSGTSEGEVCATEDEAWLAAYIARAFWP